MSLAASVGSPEKMTLLTIVSVRKGAVVAVVAANRLDDDAPDTVGAKPCVGISRIASETTGNLIVLEC